MRERFKLLVTKKDKFLFYKIVLTMIFMMITPSEYTFGRISSKVDYNFLMIFDFGHKIV